jgi:hypothetical protein
MSDKACIVKINLADMDAEMRSSKVNSLLKEGFEIKSTVPITDEGKPFLLLILQHKTPDTYADKHLYTFWILFIILIAIHIYEILN